MPWAAGDDLSSANLNNKGGAVFNVKDEDYGAVGDGVTDDTAAIQAAIDAASAVGGGVVFFPSCAGASYRAEGLTAVSNKIVFAGESSGDSELVFLKARTNSGTTLTVTGNTFAARGVGFNGLSSIAEAGEDVTSTGILFRPAPEAPDIDAVFQNCAFGFHQDCIRAEGRNLRFSNCLFAASKRGIYVPSTGLTDIRGLELYGIRFHSMGKTGASNAACVLIEAATDWQELILTGFDADDCLTLFSGFASGAAIGGGVISKARGTGLALDSTNCTLSAERRGVVVGPLTYWQQNAATVAASMLAIAGTQHVIVAHGLVSLGSGGHAISTTGKTLLSACVAHNAGQTTNNTYDAYNVAGNQNQVIGCVAYQAQTTVPANGARYGFNFAAGTSAGGCWGAGAFETAIHGGTGALPSYTPINISVDRAYDADATSVAELGDVLGTLITDLQVAGVIR